jgi:hypothetical protein
MIRNYLICLILILSSLIGQAQVVDSMQVDVVDLVVGRKKIEETNDVRNKRKVHFSILPAPVSAPGGGRVIITSINGAFTIGDPDKTNLSNVYLLPFTDFSSRYGLFLRHNIWLPNNSWNLIGDYRLSHYPQYVWGLGGNSQEFERSLVDTDYSRIYQTVLRGISKKWFVGPGYALDYSYNIEETEIGFISNLENYSATIRALHAYQSLHLAVKTKSAPISTHTFLRTGRSMTGAQKVKSLVQRYA